MFKDVKFMTADEKTRVLRSWKLFIQNGFRFESFHDRLYKHLHLHCSFIAHYDKRGFWETYFREPDTTIAFLSQFDNRQGNIAVEMGVNWWKTSEDYADLNTAMCDFATPRLNQIYVELGEKMRERDLAAANALLQLHGHKPVPMTEEKEAA